MGSQTSELVAHLVELRRRQGVSQMDIAMSMNVSQSSVSRFERAPNDPRISTVHRYCAALGVTLHFSVELPARLDASSGAVAYPETA